MAKTMTPDESKAWYVYNRTRVVAEALFVAIHTTPLFTPESNDHVTACFAAAERFVAEELARCPRPELLWAE